MFSVIPLDNRPSCSHIIFRAPIVVPGWSDAMWCGYAFGQKLSAQAVDISYHKKQMSKYCQHLPSVERCVAAATMSFAVRFANLWL